MFVCLCRAVTDGEIAAAVRAGAASAEQVSATTGASTACGSCRPLVEQLVAEARSRATAPEGVAGSAPD